MALRKLMGKDPNYEFVQPLGQGGFGTVVKVRRVSDGQIMACKAIDCSSHPELIKFAEREVQTWASFASSEKYIARFTRDIAWMERTQTMRLYMKYYEGGDLQKVLDSCRFEGVMVHPFIATYWSMEIARGVKTCHDHGIIHRDLKPANILLEFPYKFNYVLWAVSKGQAFTGEQKLLAQEFSTWLEHRPPWCHITDFGLGKISAAAKSSAHHTIASSGIIGSSGFMAPETTGEEPKFSIQSDIYSLGCLLYSLCSCRRPPSLGTPGLKNSEISKEYPKRLRDIVVKCMARTPGERPNSREVANEISEAYMDILEDDQFGKMRTKLARGIERDTVNPGSSMPRIETAVQDTAVGIVQNPRTSVQSGNPTSFSTGDLTSVSGGTLTSISSVTLGSNNLDSVFSSMASFPSISDSRILSNEQKPEPLQHSSEEETIKPETNPYKGKPKPLLDSLLRDALIRRNAEEMELIIAAGANVDGYAFNYTGYEDQVADWTPRLYPFTEEGIEASSMLRSNRPVRIRLFQYAILANSQDCLGVLLSANAEYNLTSDDRHPLFVAALYDKPDIIYYLIKVWDFDINISIDFNRNTPLVTAIIHRSENAVRMLLDLGANPKITNRAGNCVLHMVGCDNSRSRDVTSALNCFDMIIKTIPEFVSHKNILGDTPLHYAVLANDGLAVPLVRRLMKAGADPYILNGEGKDVFHVDTLGWKSSGPEVIQVLHDPYRKITPMRITTGFIDSVKWKFFGR